jgi:hypothetical protein
MKLVLSESEGYYASVKSKLNSTEMILGRIQTTGYLL